MNVLNPPSLIPLTKFEVGIIRRKVDSMIGCAGFTEADRKSLEQDLVLCLMQSLHRFDPAIADRKAFSTTVVVRNASKMLRYRFAQKRDVRRVQSLNLTVNQQGRPVQLAETVGAAEYDARRQSQSICPTREFELQHDLEAALAKLPDELRELAERLKSKSLKEIGRELNISRRKLRKQVKELRDRLEKENLRFYL